VVTGEGGSGGALAIGVGDRILMLQYSVYSVISPEGCASILWKSAEKASEAAAAMELTASKLKKLGLIDQVIPEPLGGAHRDVATMAMHLQKSLVSHLAELQQYPLDQLLDMRYKKLMAVGMSKN
jgi:acetyl-CoA carboxylase carboxyl transferase subunit alpha